MGEDEAWKCRLIKFSSSYSMNVDIELLCTSITTIIVSQQRRVALSQMLLVYLRGRGTPLHVWYSRGLRLWTRAGLVFSSQVVFTALHALHMQRGLVTIKLSFRPSVSQTRDLWQNEMNVCQHSYTAWKIMHPSFVTKRMVGVGRPLLPEILGQNDPVGAKKPIFNRYSLIAPQP